MACLLVSSLFALTACGGAKEEDRTQVEMRDMDVVDGTIDDSMTNLDAVRADGTALANSTANGSASGSDRPASRAGQRETRDEIDEAEANAEAVAVD